MSKTEASQSTENIVQLPSVRRPVSVTPMVSLPRIARPQPLAVVPFDAWLAVRDRVAGALLSGMQCVVITGDPGTGKTVILDDVARVLRAAGRAVVVRQADAEPTSPARGETLFVDEADRLPPAALRQLLEQSAGTVVLAGLSGLERRVGKTALHVSLAPLGQEAARDYVAQWLASTGRVPAQFDSAALRQVVEASGGVPRLLSTLLGAGAWLAESSGAATITAAHISEAAELRSVLSPDTPPPERRAPAGRSRIVWSLVLTGAVLVGSAAVIAPRLFPAETSNLGMVAAQAVGRARHWLGGVSGKRQAPAAAVLPAGAPHVLPAVSPHVVPRPEAVVVAGAGALAAPVLPGVVAPAAPVVVTPVTVVEAGTETATGALLPIGTQALLIRRGRAMAAVEDISAARLLFRRAAEGGSAEAAYELGRTYDPSLQTGLGKAQADLAEALRWYRRAAAEGDTAARRALEQK